MATRCRENNSEKNEMNVINGGEPAEKVDEFRNKKLKYKMLGE